MTGRDDIVDLHTAYGHYVILIDESMFGRFRSFKGHRSRRRRCSLLHCGHISVVLRKVEADKQPNLYNYTINFGACFTLVHHPMGGADDIR